MRILSFSVAHDSSVCVLNDGKIEFFSKEERLTRVKRDGNPFKSLELCASLNLGSIDSVVYSHPTQTQTTTRGFYYMYLSKKFNLSRGFVEYPHHLSHAAIAFVNSGFEESLVIVVDHEGSVIQVSGNDENTKDARESESVFLFNREKGYKMIQKNFWISNPSMLSREKLKLKNHIQSKFPDVLINVHNSLGVVKVYEAATTLIGQGLLDGGKTMGLSSYGEDKEYPKLFHGDIPLEHNFSVVEITEDMPNPVNPGSTMVCFLGDENKITNNINPDNYQYYANRAKQVQLQTQEVVCDLIKKYVNSTGIKNVCISGGYGLNVVANNYYLKNMPDVNFYFEPVSDDTGIAIGAAYIKHWDLTGELPKKVENNFFHYYDSSEKLKVGKTADLAQVVSLLVDGKSVAIFEGNPEAGPRALGHRSILFDPRNPDAKEIVNKIKKREWYRPFAGIVLEDQLHNYFHDLGINQSPYMTINFDAKEETKKLVPGIIHVDGTCRIQTVNSGFIFDLIQLFYEKTGCPIILNTSFNLAGEPLVQTKDDALKTLYNSNLDAVFFVDDNKLVLK